MGSNKKYTQILLSALFALFNLLSGVLARLFCMFLIPSKKMLFLSLMMQVTRAKTHQCVCACRYGGEIRSSSNEIPVM